MFLVIYSILQTSLVSSFFTSVHRIRFKVENMIGHPLDWSGDAERNQLMYESAKPMAELYSPLIALNRTHILQEYFIPSDNRIHFVDWMQHVERIVNEIGSCMSHVSLLNITIRYLVKDDVTVLKYAPRNSYAFVFYFRASCTHQAELELRTIHHLLTEKALSLGGTFYLPYRHDYTHKQMKLAYPNIEEFFETKKRYDPDGTI